MYTHTGIHDTAPLVPECPPSCQIFFYGWIVLAFLILMNIAVAILMDAYSEAKEESAA